MPSSETSKNIFYNYIIESLKKSELYTGFSNDLKKRINEHNQGLNISTKPYRP